MSDMTIFPPDLDDLLTELKNEIFATMNCIQVGKIEKYDKLEQSASVQIQVKRRVNKTEIKSYPLLTDCPIVVLQGGGAFLDFPIEIGDYCLLIFNDREIDNWWTTGNVKETKTLRKHSLSDGFALVGINPKSNTLSLDGIKVVLNAANKIVDIKATQLNMLGATESFLKGTTYKTAWTAFNSAVQGATSGSESSNSSGIETIKAAFSAFNGAFTTYLSQTIKGE